MKKPELTQSQKIKLRYALVTGTFDKRFEGGVIDIQQPKTLIDISFPQKKLSIISLPNEFGFYIKYIYIFNRFCVLDDSDKTLVFLNGNKHLDSLFAIPTGKQETTENEVYLLFVSLKFGLSKEDEEKLFNALELDIELGVSYSNYKKSKTSFF